MQAIRFKKIRGEKFSTIKECVDVTKSRPVQDCWKHDYDSEYERKEVGDGNSIGGDASREECMMGSDRFSKQFDEARKEVERQAKEYFTSVRFVRSKQDVVGSSVNVARARAGYPRAFSRRLPDRRPKKVVAINFALDVRWSYSAENRLRNAVAIMAVVEQLEKSGYSVALNMFATACCNGHDDDILVCLIPMKSYSSPLNAKKVQFPMASKSVLFHLGCFWKHHYPQTHYMSCEGYAVNYKNRDGELREWCDSMGEIYLSNGYIDEHDLDSGNRVKNIFEFVEGEIGRLSKRGAA